MEKALSLLNERGRLGFILPHKFFNAKYGEPLRGVIAEGKHLSQIVHFGDQQVFAGATTYTCLLFLEKGVQEEFEFVNVTSLDRWRQGEPQLQGHLPSDHLMSSEWSFTVGEGAALMDKLKQVRPTLGEIAHLFVGLQTDADDVYILELVREEDSVTYCQSAFTGLVHAFESAHLKHFVKGSVNIRRYFLSSLTKRLIFPYETVWGRSVLIDSKKYAIEYPLTWAYLNECKKRLTARNKGAMSGPEWYGYVYRKNHTRLDSPKLLVPSLANRSTFVPDLEGKYFFAGSGGGGGGGYGVSLPPDSQVSYMYLLGVLNSSISNYFLRATSTTFRGGYLALNRQYIEQLPIRTIDFNDPTDVKHHDETVALVTRMLELHKRLGVERNPQVKTVVQRQIEATDRQIDWLVYRLYGLTEAEIRIIEDAT